MKDRKLIWIGLIISFLLLFAVIITPSNPQIKGTQIERVIDTPTPTASLTPISTTEPASTNNLSNDNYYINTQGNEVHSPAYSNSVPAGATAICGDGTYSFSQSRRGTCSHHGGVSQWL